MPESFDLTTDSEELWTPIAFTPQQRAMHDEHYLTVYGRLKPGVTRRQVQSQLDAVAMRLRRDFPKDDETISFGTVPFVEQFVGDYRQRLLTLLAAVGVVLLIACGNVANLLLARGAVRAREIALRTALGAGQWRIVRQLLTESLVLAMGAAVAGLFIARAFITAVVAWSPSDVPRLEQARIDPMAFGFAIAIALASSVLCGLAPALRLSRRRDLQNGLRDGGRGSTGGHPRSPARRADRRRSGAVAAAARRRRPADSQRHRAAANGDRIRTARRVERSYHVAGHRLQGAGTGRPRRCGRFTMPPSPSRASRLRRSRRLPRWAAAAEPTVSSRKAASRTRRT